MTSVNPDILSTFSGAKTIGRYFTVVSFLPSVPFVAYALLLQKSGAWNGAVSMGQAVVGPDATDAVVLAVGSLALAMALHPLQFALVQFFEGYWGSSRAATYVATSCIQRHRRRQSKLTDEAWRLGTSSQHAPDVRRRASIASAHRGVVAELVRASESGRQTTFYPAELEMIMPTMLGNVLRRYELEAGKAYGLNCLTVLPRIMQRADQRDIDYVQNQRTQLDLAVRTATLSLAATGLTVAYMWSHGLWLLLTLIPGVLAFAAYRGAVRVAHEYGMSLAVLLDLNRFTFYEQMRLELPDDVLAERDLNSRLMPLLGLDPYARAAGPRTPPIKYRHPSPATPAPAQSPTTEPESSATPASADDSDPAGAS